MLRLHPLALAAALVAPILAIATPASADDDHERARAALRAGRVLPLEAIVARASSAFGGTVLDVEIEDDDHGYGRRAGRPDRIVYEVKMLVPGGRLLKLIYDAETGDLLASRGRGHRDGPRETR